MHGAERSGKEETAYLRNQERVHDTKCFMHHSTESMLTKTQGKGEMQRRSYLCLPSIMGITLGKMKIALGGRAHDGKTYLDER